MTEETAKITPERPDKTKFREVKLRRLLSDIHAINERQYFKGDYGATDELIDLERAIEKAGLTDKQGAVINLTYLEEFTQVEVGKALGCDRTTVSRHLSAAISKIANHT